MNGRASRKHPAIIAVTSSSRKAGKSAVASYLVRELGAEFGLKVSSGSHAPAGSLTTDPKVISRKGTDTGKLVEAGASRVLWVHAEPGRLNAQLQRALAVFPEKGLLVVEGNSAAVHLDPDYAVFLMAVPFDQFKPSALPALERADLVLVDLTGALGELEPTSLEAEVNRLAPSAIVISYDDDAGRKNTLAETARLIRTHLSLGGFV
ncbi:MAG: hypothetical protein KKF66_00235 [Actinobacteria bacterium]|nr:hypothetical protein [Actinomycetota bacterium]